MDTLLRKPKPLIDYTKLIVEFMGVCTLTYVGCLSVIYTDLNTMTLNGIGLSTALVLATFIWFGLEISGAHYNPAITIALVMIKQVNWYTGTLYIFAQFAGALVGAGTVYVQLNASVAHELKTRSVMGIPRATSLTHETSSLWGEVLGAYMIMFVYMATCTTHNMKRVAGVGGAAVGFAAYVATVTLGELSGGGFNPARSLAPAIFAGRIEKEQFIHFFGPMIGAALGCLFYRFIFIEDEEDLREEEQEKQLIQMNAASLNKSTDHSEVY